MYQKLDIREHRMDLRDERIRLYRKLSVLKDIEFWEPENLTEDQKHQMKVLEYKIAELYEMERECRSD